MSKPHYKLFPNETPSEASWLAITNLDAFEICLAYNTMRCTNKAEFDRTFDDSHVLANIAYLFPAVLQTFPDLPWNKRRIDLLNRHVAGMTEEEVAHPLHSPGAMAGAVSREHHVVKAEIDNAFAANSVAVQVREALQRMADEVKESKDVQPVADDARRT